MEAGKTVLGKLKGYIDLGLFYYYYFGCAGSLLQCAGFPLSGSVRVQSSQQGCPRA